MERSSGAPYYRYLKRLSQELTDLTVIGFDANTLIGRSRMFKPSVVKAANRSGFTVFNDVEDLLKALGEIHYERSYLNH